MITLTAFELELGAWLTACLPGAYANRVVAADTGGVALSQPYATFKVIDETPLNCRVKATLTATAAPGGAPGEFVEVIEQTQRLLVSLNLYGPTAFADAQAFVLEYQRSARKADASARGFTAAFHTGVRRLVQNSATQDEQRAQLDLTLYTKRRIERTNTEVATVDGDFVSE